MIKRKLLRKIAGAVLVAIPVLATAAFGGVSVGFMPTFTAFAVTFGIIAMVAGGLRLMQTEGTGL